MIGTEIAIVWRGRRYALVQSPTAHRLVPLGEATWILEDALRSSLAFQGALEDIPAVRQRIAQRRASSSTQAARDLLREGTLVVVTRFPWAAAGGSAGDGEVGASPASQAVAGRSLPSTELSFYEIRVVDELDNPIAGIPVRLSAGSLVADRTTNGEGRARLADAPAGFGHARLDEQALRTILADRAESPRRTSPLPDDAAVHARTLRNLGGSLVLPDGEPQTILLITRVDLHHDAHARPYAALEPAVAEGPWRLENAKRLRLALHADGTKVQACLVAPSLAPVLVAPAPPPPPSPPTPFQAPNHYVVQSGDTLVGIAARLLGDGSRWTEIWALSKADFPSRSPDVLYPGDVLTLPPSAVPSFVALPVSALPGDEVLVPPPPLEWLRETIDDLHQALLDERWSELWTTLASIPTEVPAAEPPPVSSYWDELHYRAALVELALHGYVDFSPIAPMPTEPPP